MSKLNENVFKATNLTAGKRDRLFRDVDLASLKDKAVEKRTRSLESADELWRVAARGFEKRGIRVFFAETASEANAFIRKEMTGAELVVKGKSLTTEEMELRQALAADGIEVVETDLGEWIIQQRNELPSHFTAPAIHLSAAQISKLINTSFGETLPADPLAITIFARNHLRQRFLCADAGIIGANAVIADPATVISVSNEGNVSLCARLPEKLFVVTGWDRIYDNADGIEDVQRLLTGSATAQEYTSYVDFIREPLPHQQVTLVVLNNGRKALLSGSFGETGRCIRCGACLNICPAYQEVGGHTFGRVYHGGIGALLTRFTGRPSDARDIASYCLRCRTCEPVCPMRIPIADLVATASENDSIPLYLSFPLKLMGPAKPVQSPRNEDVKTAEKTAVFLGCVFRTPFLSRERNAIKRAVNMLFPGATLFDSGCCGMPHYYKGHVAESRERVQALTSLLTPYDRVLVPCSSGFSFLREQIGENVRLMSMEIAGKMAAINPTCDVFYHSPCHLKTRKDVDEQGCLTEIVPFVSWENQDRCCGSGGTYFLQHPGISKKILSRKQISSEGTFAVLTSCPSCLLQLRRTFGTSHVRHTVDFLVEHMTR